MFFFHGLPFHLPFLMMLKQRDGFNSSVQSFPIDCLVPINSNCTPAPAIPFWVFEVERIAFFALVYEFFFFFSIMSLFCLFGEAQQMPICR